MPFPFRFQIQLQSRSNPLSGCLQRHVQRGRHRPPAQQRVLVQGDVHAEGPGQLGSVFPTQLLRTGLASPLTVSIAAPLLSQTFSQVDLRGGKVFIFCLNNSFITNQGHRNCDYIILG